MISIKNIKKAFNQVNVLNGINLDVAKGESMVVIGGSGTGKSVLLKVILGLIQPDSGEIFLEGQSLSRIGREQFLERFGMLFQGGALFDSLNVWQNISFRLIRGNGRINAKEAREIAEQKLQRVGLKPEISELFPSELSGGMQKRVGLARAIASNPEIIFFDEPTTGLDPIMAGVINELIREIVVEMGVTAITITHDMASARAIGDKIAMIHNGIIQWNGQITDLEKSNDPYLIQFLNGSSNGPIKLTS
ncbi:MAG: ABC transporter ATP-binding protein [Paracoccaceae bacterium]|nr:MAG: ATP-binding cassette domain-containing protein [Paracoccaceae bacterium]|tara:strand:- start:4509 stop:5255 length:747 start_codon:yes stop_codon:yes gene_type:complete